MPIDLRAVLPLRVNRVMLHQDSCPKRCTVAPEGVYRRTWSMGALNYVMEVLCSASYHDYAAC
jgi:hypothetical protein